MIGKQANGFQSEGDIDICTSHVTFATLVRGRSGEHNAHDNGRAKATSGHRWKKKCKTERTQKEMNNEISVAHFFCSSSSTDDGNGMKFHFSLRTSTEDRQWRLSPCSNTFFFFYFWKDYDELWRAEQAADSICVSLNVLFAPQMEMIRSITFVMSTARANQSGHSEKSNANMDILVRSPTENTILLDFDLHSELFRFRFAEQLLTCCSICRRSYISISIIVDLWQTCTRARAHTTIGTGNRPIVEL